MFKQRIIKSVGSLTLLAAITDLSGIMANSPAQACSTGSSTGGGC